MNAVEIALRASGAVGEALAALCASPVKATAYDPENLRHVHARNDEVLERVSIGRCFENDAERLEKLFSRYTAMTAAEKAKPATRAAKGKKP